MLNAHCPEPFCFVILNKKHDLLEHVLQHNERPFFCHCGRTFFSFHALTRHQHRRKHIDRSTKYIHAYCGCCKQVLCLYKWGRYYHIDRHLKMGHVSQAEELEFIITPTASEAQAIQTDRHLEMSPVSQPEELGLIISPTASSDTNLPHCRQTEAQANQNNCSPEYSQGGVASLPSIRSILQLEMDAVIQKARERDQPKELGLVITPTASSDTNLPHYGQTAQTIQTCHLPEYNQDGEACKMF